MVTYIKQFCVSAGNNLMYNWEANIANQWLQSRTIWKNYVCLDTICEHVSWCIDMWFISKVYAFFVNLVIQHKTIISFLWSITNYVTSWVNKNSNSIRRIFLFSIRLRYLYLHASVLAMSSKVVGAEVTCNVLTCKVIASRKLDVLAKKYMHWLRKLFNPT